MPSSPAELIQLTAQIVSAHCANAKIEADALPGLIREVHQALAAVEAPVAADPETLAPAVPIKKSVFPDYIVCLEDGKKLKMLKRHLKSAYGMTPEEYRAKWGLPASYPMVAPSYAEKRSTLARQIGLGRRSGDAQAADETLEAEAETVDEPKVQKLPARKRGTIRRKG